ncbi:MAG: heavy metal-binding domain-containing protein [Bacteroidota bacterium]
MSNHRLKNTLKTFTTPKITILLFGTLMLIQASNSQTLNSTSKKDTLLSVSGSDSINSEGTDSMSFPSHGTYRSQMEWKLISRKAREAAKKKSIYFICPNHPDKISLKDGNCAECNSHLIHIVPTKEKEDSNSTQQKTPE